MDMRSPVRDTVDTTSNLRRAEQDWRDQGFNGEFSKAMWSAKLILGAIWPQMDGQDEGDSYLRRKEEDWRAKIDLCPGAGAGKFCRERPTSGPVPTNRLKKAAWKD